MFKPNTGHLSFGVFPPADEVQKIKHHFAIHELSV
jgi:hypothetical protein